MLARRIFSRMLILGLIGIVSAAGAVTIDAVVATVDEEPILQSDLLVEIAPLLQSLQASSAPSEQKQREMDAALQKALDQQIEQRLLYRHAQLRGFQIEEEAVDDRIEDIKKSYGSNEAFLDALRTQGETMSEFRERLRRQAIAVTMAARQRQEFERQAVVTESELAQYYQDNESEFSHGERIRLRRIFLAATSPEDKAKARARLEALRDELAAGGDFLALAQAHSEGPEASTGGLVGWVERGDLVPALEEAVFALGSGEVSTPVEIETGYLLLKAEERVEAGTVPYAEARTQIEPIIRSQYAAQRYEKWIRDLRDRSRVRILM